MRAFCFASGHIDFGNRVPAGAMVIARGPAETLKAFILVNARHGYDTRLVRGRRVAIPGSQYLLVPGVPEADNPIVAVERLSQWCKRIALNPPAGVRVLPV